MVQIQARHAFISLSNPNNNYISWIGKNIQAVATLIIKYTRTYGKSCEILYKHLPLSFSNDRPHNWNKILLSNCLQLQRSGKRCYNYSTIASGRGQPRRLKF